MYIPYVNNTNKVDVRNFIGQTVQGVNPATKKREDFRQPQVNAQLYGEVKHKHINEEPKYKRNLGSRDVTKRVQEPVDKQFHGIQLGRDMKAYLLDPEVPESVKLSFVTAFMKIRNLRKTELIKEQRERMKDVNQIIKKKWSLDGLTLFDMNKDAPSHIDTDLGDQCDNLLNFVVNKPEKLRKYWKTNY